MALKIPAPRYLIGAGIVLFVGTLGLYWGGTPLWGQAARLYALLDDPERAKTFITAFGVAAPLVFIGFQILQVLLAPFPGEASGFIGGYLFGTGLGFVYSSIGLTAGSWLNFMVGRFLGRRFVHRLIPSTHLVRMNSLLERQGVFVVFMLFVIPGFPKDYLCLFLGLSTMPMRLLLCLAAIGRMPGTYMLSLQGAYVSERMYGPFFILLALMLLVALIFYRHRERFYAWLERLNSPGQGR